MNNAKIETWQFVKNELFKKQRVTNLNSEAQNNKMYDTLYPFLTIVNLKNKGNLYSACSNPTNFISIID